MYFPYLRGKQNELLALRQLVEDGLLGENIIPIIEPVKASSTLRITVETFQKFDRKIVIIINPGLGDFSDELDKLDESSQNDYLSRVYLSECVIIGHIINPNSEKQIDDMTSKGFSLSDMMLLHLNRSYQSIYENLTSFIYPKYSVVLHDNTMINSAKGHLIVIKDHFPKKHRNVDYSFETDEFFSDSHLIFVSPNYYGFSDYSIIGQEFIDTGFLPNAVAIHMVYISVNREMHIKHYVSDTNDDNTNQALKKYQALTKMIKDKQLFIMSKGFKELEKYQISKKDPGLGSLKRYAIMHHLETISTLI